VKLLAEGEAAIDQTVAQRAVLEDGQDSFGECRRGINVDQIGVFAMGDQ
jgi:hypothetical protein